MLLRARVHTRKLTSRTCCAAAASYAILLFYSSLPNPRSLLFAVPPQHFSRFPGTCSPGNGHLKARPKLCIHPGHLHPSSSMNYGPLLMPLVGVVHALKLFKEDNNIAIELKELGWNDTQFNSVKAKNPTEIFEKLLNRIKVAWANRPPDPVFEITSDSPKNGAVTQGRSPASRRASGSSRKPSAGRGGGGGRR